MTLADIDLPGAVLRRRGRRDRARRRRCGRSCAPRRGPRSTRWRCAPATSASSSARRRRRRPGRPSRRGRAGGPGEAELPGVGQAGARDRATRTIRPTSAPGSASGSGSPPASAPGSPARSPGPPRAPSAAPGWSPRSCAAAPAPRPPRPRAAPTPGSRSGCCSTSRPRDSPEADFFLFEDRAYTHAAAKRRVDNVVRGLLSLGVRQGEHVGVLMGTRPSALSLVAALNRLGAVAVLMRPDGAGRARGRARPGRAGSSPTPSTPSGPRRDRRRGARARRRRRAERDLGRGVIDMERIDPDEVEVPAWYRAEPRPRPRPRLHPLHRRGRAHPRQPDHQRPLGAVGVRHRVGRGAVAAPTPSTR